MWTDTQRRRLKEKPSTETQSFQQTASLTFKCTKHPTTFLPCLCITWETSTESHARRKNHSLCLSTFPTKWGSLAVTAILGKVLGGISTTRSLFSGRGNLSLTSRSYSSRTWPNLQSRPRKKLELGIIGASRPYSHRPSIESNSNFVLAGTLNSGLHWNKKKTPRSTLSE